MRHDSAGRRSRNRHGGGQQHHNQGGQRRGGFGGGGGHGGNIRSQVFDSNGPEVRIRGTAFQICEKYQALAKDAASADNRVLAESYLQHAEHYQRLINQWNEENGQRPERFQPSQNADGTEEQPVVSVTSTIVTPEAAQTEDDLGLPASLLGQPRQMADA